MTSGYMVERMPDFYGGKQVDYLAKVNSIVQETAEKFAKADKSSDKLTELFHQTLASIGAARHNMAPPGTRDAQFFGIRRDKPPLPGTFIKTPLTAQYQEYNDRMVGAIQKILRSRIAEDKPKERELDEKIAHDSCLGRKTSLDYSFLTSDNIEEWLMHFSIKELREIYALCEIPFTEIPSTESQLSEEEFVVQRINELLKNKEAMEKLRKRSFHTFQKLKTTQMVLEMLHLFKVKSNFILVTFT